MSNFIHWVIFVEIYSIDTLYGCLHMCLHIPHNIVWMFQKMLVIDMLKYSVVKWSAGNLLEPIMRVDK